MRDTPIVERPTLFAFAGGDEAVRALTEALHARCLADPVLNHPFSHPDQDPDHLRHLADYLAEALGGPPRYSGSLGGHSRMLTIHAGQGAEADLGDRFVTCFLQSMDDAGWPDDPAFRAAVREGIERATDEVMSYAPREARVPNALPMPVWGWTDLGA
jgi:hemoglobin